MTVPRTVNKCESSHESKLSFLTLCHSENFKIIESHLEFVIFRCISRKAYVFQCNGKSNARGIYNLDHYVDLQWTNNVYFSSEFEVNKVIIWIDHTKHRKKIAHHIKFYCLTLKQSIGISLWNFQIIDFSWPNILIILHGKHAKIRYKYEVGTILGKAPYIMGMQFMNSFLFLQYISKHEKIISLNFI